MTLTLFSYLNDVMNIGEGSNALGKTASKLFWKIENCSFWPNFCEIWPWPSFALLFLVDLIEINIFPNIMSIQKSYRLTAKKLFMFKVKFQIISWPLTLTFFNKQVMPWRMVKVPRPSNQPCRSYSGKLKISVFDLYFLKYDLDLHSR